ncbi:MAG: endolytic transglycosylase MltG [Spirochaetales bacterium]|jgi:UPF0755 protein|nr:endolytic transglycosylase MltG [Spirochaetales bacterium]
MKKFARFFAVLFGMLIAALLLVVGGAFYLNKAPENIPREGVLFRVEVGDSMVSIADRLKSEGLVRTPLLIRVLCVAQGTEGVVKIGTYKILPGYSSLDILNLLVSGKQQLYRITVPEGRTLRQIADYLESEGITDGDNFQEIARNENVTEMFGVPGNSVEGYLFPDTYYIQKDYPAEKVLKHLTERFFEVLEEIAPEYREMGPREITEKVILASIIEREYQIDEEAPLMASVFYNRLEIGMTLGSCATVVYIITERQGKEHPSFLTYDDIEVEDPFNTYIHQGLPPSPISNPGRVALDAAFHPAESDYLYFLLKDDNTGAHYFSMSLSEHNQAHVLYLKKK